MRGHMSTYIVYPYLERHINHFCSFDCWQFYVYPSCRKLVLASGVGWTGHGAVIFESWLMIMFDMYLFLIHTHNVRQLMNAYKVILDVCMLTAISFTIPCLYWNQIYLLRSLYLKADFLTCILSSCFYNKRNAFSVFEADIRRFNNNDKKLTQWM